MLFFDFENPKKRDIALKDRIKETYVNVTLCDDGCVNTGIDLKNNVATCDCKFNDITNNEIIHDNAALNYLIDVTTAFGEILEKTLRKRKIRGKKGKEKRGVLCKIK